MSSENLNKVLTQLSRYEHPLFEFSAHEDSGEVEVAIRAKLPTEYPEFTFSVTERDLNNTQFPWTFQRLLYGCQYAGSPHIELLEPCIR